MLSNLEYLSYPLPSDIRRLSEAGDFARMERVIALRLADPRTPKCLHDRLRFELEVAKLTPKYYPYTADEIFEFRNACIQLNEQLIGILGCLFSLLHKGIVVKTGAQLRNPRIQVRTGLQCFRKFHD